MAYNDSIASSKSSSSAGGVSSASDGDSIRVFVRVRPLTSETTDADRGLCLEVQNTQIVMHAKPDYKVFTFDDVADQQSTQEKIFCGVGKKIIDGCIGGYNGTIFAYGQTGSGKTFTMLGPNEGCAAGSFQHELRGVIPRSFDYLFKSLQKEQDLQSSEMQFMCKVSFLEIYNEQVFDLLDPSSPSLQLRENLKHGIFVEHLRELDVKSAAEAYAVLNRGWASRTVAETTMNRESSRSHAVFTVNIETKVNKDGVWAIKSSQLHLVDLAGSERQKDTNTSGVRLKEAGSINRSLSTLGNVIMALVDISRGKVRHIPYRDSKLTFLLKDSLGGNSRTCIIACVHPGSKCFGETLSTLQFAKRAKLIKNRAVVNEDMQGSVIHLQAEIKRLKEQLAQFSAAVPVTDQVVATPSQHVVSSADLALAGEYRVQFLQAMVLRQNSDDERQVYAERCAMAEEINSRKDKALSQLKLILKFREEALKRVEKALKEKSGLDQDDKDALIENLRAQIRSLESVVNYHPEMTKYRIENENQRNEIGRLRHMLNKGSGYCELSAEKVDELDQLFVLLLDSQMADTSLKSPRAISSPMGNSRNTVTTAAVNQYKLQVEQLENDLEKLKADSQQECQRLQRQLIEAESQIAGLSRGKEEMEKVLKAHQLRAKIERDVHNDTIKTITTPKKNASSLPHDSSNGNILGSRSPDLVTCTLSPVRAASSGIELITGMTPPQHVDHQELEGLREEISVLQAQLQTIETELKSRDQKYIEVCQEKSRLEVQNKLLDEMMERNRIDWQSQNTELQHKLAAAERSNAELTVNNNVLSGECQDLRVMSIASDRKQSELQGEIRQLKSAMEKEIDKLETEVLKLTVERNDLRSSYDSQSEEIEQLKEEVETLRATIDFNEEQMSKTESQLINANNKNEELSNIIKVNERLVESLRAEKEIMLTRLKQETGAKDSQLLHVMQQLEAATEHLNQANLEKESIRSSLVTTESKLSDAKAAADLLKKSEAVKEEAIVSLTAANSELREMIAERDSTIATHRSEAEQQLAHYESVANGLQLQLKQQQSKYQEEIRQLQAVASRHNAEMEMMKEDLDSHVMRIDSLVVQLNDEHQHNAELKREYDELLENNTRLNAEISILQRTLAELQAIQDQQPDIALLQSQLSNLQEAFDVVSSHSMKIQDELTDTKQQCSSTLVQLSSMQTRYNDILQQYASVQDENQNLETELVHWKEECETVKVLKEENLKLSERVTKLEEELEREVSENAKLTGHRNLSQRINYVERLRDQLTASEKKVRVLEAEIESLKRSLSSSGSTTGLNRSTSQHIVTSSGVI